MRKTWLPDERLLYIGKNDNYWESVRLGCTVRLWNMPRHLFELWGKALVPIVFGLLILLFVTIAAPLRAILYLLLGLLGAVSVRQLPETDPVANRD